MKLLTQSEMKDYQRCLRKWWLAHYRNLGLRSDYSSPSNVGDLVHDALAAYYARTIEDPVLHVRGVADELAVAMPDFAVDIAKDADLAGIMVEGYMEWLEETGADYELKVISPEKAARAIILPDVELIGKLDAEVENRDGFKGFLEHKTVGNFVDLPAVAQIDRQLLTYHLLKHLEQVQVQRPEDGVDEVVPPPPKTFGAILNMLRKVKRTARANPPFYMREPVTHNVDQLRSHWKHVVAIAQGIGVLTAALDGGADPHRAAPPTPTTDCRWSCSFFQICPMFDDGSDVESVIEQQYETRDPLLRYDEEHKGGAQ